MYVYTVFGAVLLQIQTLQIAEAMPKSPTLSRVELEQYLKTLVDDQV